MRKPLFRISVAVAALTLAGAASAHELGWSVAFGPGGVGVSIGVPGFVAVAPAVTYPAPVYAAPVYAAPSYPAVAYPAPVYAPRVYAPRVYAPAYGAPVIVARPWHRGFERPYRHWRRDRDDD